MRKRTKVILALGAGACAIKLSGYGVRAYIEKDEYGNIKKVGATTYRHFRMEKGVFRQFVENNMLLDAKDMSQSDLDNHFTENYTKVSLKNGAYLLKSNKGDHEILLTKNKRGKYSPFLIET